MKKPASVKSLETLGRVRLSDNFFMRDFLHSEISNFYGIPNIPDKPDLAIEAGSQLCQQLLEPLQARFGRLAIRGSYRSCAVNEFGNKNNLNCARNTSAYAHHNLGSARWQRVYGCKSLCCCAVVWGAI